MHLIADKLVCRQVQSLKIPIVSPLATLNTSDQDCFQVTD